MSINTSASEKYHREVGMRQFWQNDSNSVAAHGKSIAAGQQLWPCAQTGVSSCYLKVPGSPAGRAELQKVLCHGWELHASWQCSKELLLIRLEHIREQNDKELRTPDGT